MTLNQHSLDKLCYKESYFTKCTEEQYCKLRRANEENAPITEIASIIWICSDDKIRRIDILDNLKKQRRFDIKYQKI